MIEADLAVVGGGLAGLSAALAAARAGLRCVGFTGATPGGLLVSIESIQGLPGHPQGIPGYDLIPMLQEDALDAGVQFIADEVTALAAEGDAWLLRSAGTAVRARAVILAPGSRLRALGVPGEERLAGKGVSHCASCDAPLLRGRQVAVVGGGDAACQEALTLAQHAAQVHLLVRGAALRAQPHWRERVAASTKIAPRFGVQVQEILGEGNVRALRLWGGEELASDAVFIYAGLRPQTEFLHGVVALDAQGRIVVDAGLHASAPGTFAAGCARAGSSGQADEASADGAAAALAAQAYLQT